MEKRAYRILPAYKQYIWGGYRFYEWNKTDGRTAFAEAWELSFRTDGACLACLPDGTAVPLMDIAGESDIGQKAAAFPYFPLLNKFIDAADNLSVQVHPSDEYAAIHHQSYGKTEMWYVVEALAGAGLYVGFNRDLNRETVSQMLHEGSILDALNFFPVKPGDSFYIPAGTVHAIGKGVTIAEIQQNSNLTYRLYDYGRTDAAGNPRELHIERALDVLDYAQYRAKNTQNSMNMSDRVLCKSPYFTVIERKIYGESMTDLRADSFCHLMVVDGEMTVDTLPAKKGDSFFLPARYAARLTGRATALLSFVECLTAPRSAARKQEDAC